LGPEVRIRQTQFVRRHMGSSATFLDAALKWITKKGWDPQLYRIEISEVQSSPPELCCVDVNRVQAAPDESPMDERGLLRHSRVLEVNRSTGIVENVLAARNMKELRRILETEHVQARQQDAEARLAAYSAVKELEAMGGYSIPQEAFQE